MAIRRLYNMFKGFGTDPTYSRNDTFLTPESTTFSQDSKFATAGSFVDEGRVLAVLATSGAMISYRGHTVKASQATDEPLRAGQAVWVAKASAGDYIILGSK